ncbi:hypothetical protein GCM10009101_26330 [Brevundimonas lenta]
MDSCDPASKGPFIGAPLDRAITCRDLTAQESMALSTRRLVWLSWLQIFVAVGGAATVLWTVLVALRSMRLTQETLQHQQTTMRLQLRPSIKPNGAAVLELSTTRVRVDIDFENVGASTALNYRHAWAWRIVPRTTEKSELDPKKLRITAPARSLTRGTDCGFGVSLSEQSTLQLKLGTHVLQVGYCAIFEDALGGRYQYTFSRTFWGPDLAFAKALVLEFDDPQLKGREP